MSIAIPSMLGAHASRPIQSYGHGSTWPRRKSEETRSPGKAGTRYRRASRPGYRKRG